MNVKIVGAFVICAILVITLDDVSANQTASEVQPKLNGELTFKLKRFRVFLLTGGNHRYFKFQFYLSIVDLEISTDATKSDVKPKPHPDANADSKPNPHSHPHRHNHNRKACDLTHSSNMCRKHCIEKGFKRGFCNKLSSCRCRHH